MAVDSSCSLTNHMFIFPEVQKAENLNSAVSTCFGGYLLIYSFVSIYI